ncbi:hypothetical protein BDB01DRAFT_835178 [Pilobolus umbonatus]|nr:hypothetical protein BDB01DRAFT_835178 [Pilobolus umbonatus]
MDNCIPIWAVIVIPTVIIITLIIVIAIIRKRRLHSNGITLPTSNNHLTSQSAQTLVHQQKQMFPLDKEHTVDMPPLEIDSSEHLSGTYYNRTLYKAAPQTDHNNQKTDQLTLTLDKLKYNNDPPPEDTQEKQISLSLSLSSQSFFSEKMEVDPENSQAILSMLAKDHKLDKTTKTDFVSIEVDSPTFYSNATTSIQQKAATIKNKIYQSLKFSKTSGQTKQASLQNMFATEESNDRSQKHTRMGTSKSIDDNIASLSTERKETEDCVDVDNRLLHIGDIDLNGKPTSLAQKKDNLDIYTPMPSLLTNDEDYSLKSNIDIQESVQAARRIIISASRKAKTKSMIIGEKDSQMFANLDSQRQLKHGSMRFTSPNPRPKFEHATISSGSMRRLIRESIVFQDDAEPLPNLTAFNQIKDVHTISARSIRAGPTAKDIADWWENDGGKSQETKASSNDSQAESNCKTNTGYNTISKKGPEQEGVHGVSHYHAALSSSVFGSDGTLSKAFGNSLATAGFSDQSEDIIEETKHYQHSLRKGTLSRNTLKSVRMSATNGVQRSLKDLFDSSNKIVPEDSQKIEVESTIEAANRLASRSLSNLRTSHSSSFMKEPGQLLFKGSSRYYSDKDVDNSSSDRVTGDNKHEVSNKLPAGEVDAIRKMLQDSWTENIIGSESMRSISSNMDNYHNPKSINKDTYNKQTMLLNKSALAMQETGSLNISQSSGEGHNKQGPEPTASLSSSTVRTMIPVQDFNTSNRSEANDYKQNTSTGMNDSNHVETGYASSATKGRYPSQTMDTADENKGVGNRANMYHTSKRLSIYNEGDGKNMYDENIPGVPNQGRRKEHYSTMRKVSKARGSIPWS